MDAGTLDRVLSTRVGMGGLLLGKWLFIALMGIAQLTVMFLWGRLAFGLDLFHHLPGFFVMTAVTAAAAAGFGLMLATVARTRAQLSGISTIVILTMSALGGSMFPRFLMSETMQKFGLLTFNGWALDGYLKVFWRNAPVWQLWPQVLVLSTARRGLHVARARVRPQLGGGVSRVKIGRVKIALVQQHASPDKADNIRRGLAAVDAAAAAGRRRRRVRRARLRTIFPAAPRRRRSAPPTPNRCPDR